MASLPIERSTVELHRSLAALEVTDMQTGGPVQTGTKSLKDRFGMGKKKSKGVQKRGEFASPEEQHRRNEEAVRNYRANEEARRAEKEKERAKKTQSEKVRTAQETVDNMSAEQRKAVQEEIRKQDLNHAKDKGFARPSARASQTPRDHGSFDEVPPYQWQELETAASVMGNGNITHINETHKLVDGGILFGKVLCAPQKGNQAIVWERLEDIQNVPENIAEDYTAWQTINRWRNVFASHEDLDYLKKIGEGKYNLVYEKASGAFVDARRWPPQLSLGVLPDDAANPAIRITRGSDFGSSRENCLSETTMNLHAATIGLGPPIYAVAVFAYNELDRDRGMQRFGMVMMMKKCADFYGEVNNIIRDATSQGEQWRHHVKPRASFCAREIQLLCFRMAHLGAINFDAKPANVLVADGGNTFYLIDYDRHFFITDETVHFFVRKKARFFINLLLFTMHIRAWTDPAFADPFCKALKKPLMDLWMEICCENRSFGKLAAYKLRTMQVKRKDEMNDEYAKGNITSETHERAERIWAQFKEITYHYFLRQSSRNNHRREVAGFKWDLVQGYESMPLLVPQLLKFTLFYRGAERLSDENEEAGWMESLKNYRTA